MKKIWNKINGAAFVISEHHIDAFSAKASFFMVLSFFPFIMFVLNVLNFSPLYEMLITAVTSNLFPKPVKDLLVSIITEISYKASGTLLSVSAILMLWASSVGMLSVSRGLNVVYDKNETRNYFILRGISCFYTLLLVLCLGFIFIMLVMGNKIAQLIIETVPAVENLTILVLSLRAVVSVSVLFIFFMFIYTIIPSGKNKIRDQLPGAAFSAIGWMVFSYIFSYYFDHFSNYSYIYGSLTAVVLFMLWLYFCMYIMFVGGEINKYFMDKKKKTQVV